MFIFTLTGLFNLIQYAYTHHTANNEDIYIAAKQCSQYTIGTSYIEVGEVFRYLDFDGEENSLILDNNRLVKTPGFEILLFHVDDEHDKLMKEYAAADTIFSFLPHKL